MLSTKDVQMIREMLNETLDQRFWENNVILRDEMQSLLHIQKREMRDEIHAVVNGAVFASEARVMMRMDNLREEILDGVSDIVGDEILPQIDDLEVRVLRLEQRVA